MAIIQINFPEGCCAEPDPIRLMLEKIMASIQELQDKMDVQTALLARQSDTIAALRTYVTGIETAVRDLASGEVLSATMQTKVDALVAAIDANQAVIDANQAGLTAAGDGDVAT